VNKSLLIFRHEFLSTIKRAGFIIMTLALPVLALLAIGVTQLISGIVKPSGPAQITNIGYVDQTGGFSQFNSQGTVELKPYNTPDTALRALVQKDVKEYFVIPADYATNGMVTIYTLEKQLTAPQEVQTAIKNFLSSNLMVNKIPGATINVIESPLYLNTVRVTDTGEVAKDQGGLSNLIIPLIFGVLLAMSLSFSSSYLLQGLGEEKENRLMEILLSSVSTRQLVTGKVLGIGVAGLIQVVVWVISLPLLLHLASASIGGFISTIHIQANFLAAGIVYFILGYLLFAVLSLCVAAISPTAKKHRFGRGIYHVLCCPVLVLESADVISEQPGLDRLQYFPVLGACAGDVKAGLIRYSGLATGGKYGSNGIIDYRGAFTRRQAAEDIPADVRQTSDHPGDRQKYWQKLAARKTTFY
jgi:ABC-2 type transport system permease protein